jgi:hypothetical protein
MKKQMVVALVLLSLIPIVLILGGLLFRLINPEIAARHPNYVRNFQILSFVKHMAMWGSFAIAGILWLATCFFVIRSKERSLGWLFLAVLGPLGFAILARLKDRTPGETDRYTRFVGTMNRFVRAGYEVCTFVVLWWLASEAIDLKHYLMVLYESATTGVSTAQIITVQDASSGMWAFGEGLETMYLVVLLYALWPIAFNTVGRMAVSMAPRKAS